jgi:type II secretory pathway component PulL
MARLLWLPAELEDLDLSGLDDQGDRVAVVPAAICRLAWVQLPDLPPAQKDGAAREAIQSQILGDSESFHIVSGDELHETGLCPVAWIDKSWMRDAVRRLNASGMAVDQIIPAGLLLPRPSNAAVRALVGSETLVRTDKVVWLNDLNLNKAMLGDEIVEECQISPDCPSEGFGLNLRAGSFAPKKGWKEVFVDARIFALLAVLLILVTLLIPFVSAIRNDKAAAALEQNADAVAQQQFPNDAEPIQALSNAVFARRGGGAGFIPTASALVTAIAATPNIELTEMRFGPDGILETTLRANNEAEVAKVLERLTANGFRVEQGSRSTVQGRVMSTLRVTGQ